MRFVWVCAIVSIHVVASLDSCLLQRIAEMYWERVDSDAALNRTADPAELKKH